MPPSWHWIRGICDDRRANAASIPPQQQERLELVSIAQQGELSIDDVLPARGVGLVSEDAKDVAGHGLTTKSSHGVCLVVSASDFVDRSRQLVAVLLNPRSHRQGGRQKVIHVRGD